MMLIKAKEFSSIRFTDVTKLSPSCATKRIFESNKNETSIIKIFSIRLMDLLLFLDWCSKLRHLFITDDELKNLKYSNVYCYFGAQELSKRPQQSINSQ